jgi:hypothetical protein
MGLVGDETIGSNFIFLDGRHQVWCSVSAVNTQNVMLSGSNSEAYIQLR